MKIHAIFDNKLFAVGEIKLKKDELTNKLIV